MIRQVGTHEHCCGNCLNMDYEDTYGYGECLVDGEITHCGDSCSAWEKRH